MERAPAQSATADREIVIFRVISAPRELLFEAFTEVRHVSQTWGRRGSLHADEPCSIAFRDSVSARCLSD